MRQVVLKMSHTIRMRSEFVGPLAVCFTFNVSLPLVFMHRMQN